MSQVHSLYSKFTITTIAIMLISALTAFAFSNFYYQQKLKPENDAKNTQIAQNIALYIENHQEQNIEEYLENVANTGYQLYFIRENKTDGTLYGAPFRHHELSPETIASVQKGKIYHGMLQFPQETFVTGFFANELTNTIGVPVRMDNETYALFLRPNIKMLFNEMHILLGWLTVLTVIFSIILVLFITIFLVRPIRHLTQAVNEVATGNFDIDYTYEGKDEIGQLSKRFSHMVTQLSQLDEMRREFISNISHDIRSPLSNIKGYVSLLEDEKLSKEERLHYIDIIKSESNRLSKLSKQLLLLASLDKEDYLIHQEPFSLTSQLKQLIHQYQWQLHKNDMMISLTCPEIIVHGDATLLYSVWENFLTNAIKYNKRHGSIDIVVKETNTSIVITFTDTGIGMDEDEKEKVFERFYRVDETRTKNIEGTGLGLSIAEKIVTLHNGSIEVMSTPDKGTSFTIILPKLK